MGGVPSPTSNRRPACVMSAVVAFVHACEGRTTATARATAVSGVIGQCQPSLGLHYTSEGTARALDDGGDAHRPGVPGAGKRLADCDPRHPLHPLLPVTNTQKAMDDRARRLKRAQIEATRQR